MHIIWGKTNEFFRKIAAASFLTIMNWELLIIAATVTRIPAYVHTHCLRIGYYDRNHFHVLRRIWRPCESNGKTMLLGCHSGYVYTYVVRSHGTTFMGLCQTAAILSRESKVALFYLSSLVPKFFTARSRVVKESFFSLSGQYGRRVNKAHGVMSPK